MVDSAAPAQPQGTGSISAGTIYNLIGQMSVLVGGYGLHIGLARILGPANYGVIGVVLPLATIARVLVMDGPRQVISKLTAERADLARAIRRAALWLEGLASILVLIALLAGADVLAALLRDATLAPYIRLVTPLVPATALFSVYQASLNGLHCFGRQTVVSIVNSLGRMALSLAGAWLWGLPGALLGLAAAAALALAVAYLLVPASNGQGEFVARRLAAFSAPMVVFAVADALLMYLDLMFVKALVRQPVLVGYYAAAATVAQVPYYALLALADTLLPVTARLLENGLRERARRTIQGGLRYGLMLLVPAGVLIAATAQPLMTFLYGRTYGPAGALLAILIWAQTFYAFLTVLTALLIAESKPNVVMVLALGLLPISGALNLVLVPLWGTVGAASSTATATLVGLLVSYLLARRDFGPIVEWRSTLAIVAAAALSGALALWWHPRGMLLVPAYVVLWGADIVALWFLGEIRPADLQRVQQLLGLLRKVAA